MVTGVSSKPLHFKWFEYNNYLFSHIRSTLGILGWAGSLSWGDLKVELLLFCSLTPVDGRHPRLPVSSAKACGKGNDMDHSAGAGRGGGLWTVCGEASVTSVSVEENSITWPHLTSNVAGEYGLTVCQGTRGDEFGELMASFHQEEEREDKDVRWWRTPQSTLRLARRK